MAQDSKIEWTHHTANLWHGCTHVHEGCDFCYAEVLSKRWGNNVWGNDKPRKAIKDVWKDLTKFQKLAAAAGEMHRVFVGSMMDIFEKPMPLIDSKGNSIALDDPESEMVTGDMRDIFFNNISRGEYPNLMFLLLTKRPSNINKYIPESWKTNPPANVMFGTSVVNQQTADTLIPQLLKVNGKRFLSCEPLLGAIALDSIFIDCPECFGTSSIAIYEGNKHIGGMPCPRCLTPYQGKISGIDWIIVGGESGHKARPMHPKWAMDIRDQCATAGIPFLFKQWGEHKYFTNYPIPIQDLAKIKWYYSEGEFHEVTKDTPAQNISSFPIACRVGKKEAGNFLDDKQYLEFPKIKLV